MIGLGDDWERLIEGMDLSPLIPDVYADYRVTVVAGLKLFLRRLPEERRRQMITEQISLPPHADVVERLFHLLRQCPTLHKLGQILARHPPLPIELRTRLHALESHEPMIDPADLRGTVERVLTTVHAIELAPSRVLAEGSVAAVVACRFRRSADGEEFDAAVKILKPGIHRRLEEDLAVWPSVTEFVLSEFQNLGLHAPDVSDVFDRVSQLLRQEVDLIGERLNLQSADEEFRSCDGVRIPRLFPGCSAEALVMERLEGVKISEAAPRGSQDAITLGRRMASALVCRPMLTVGQPALFHGDPHAGNLLRGSQGELIILDWSLAGRLSMVQLEYMAQVMFGLMTLDVHRTTSAILCLAENAPSAEAIRESVARALGKISGGALPGVTGVRSLLDDAVIRGGAKFPSELLLFRKSLGMVEGVLHDLCSERALDDEVLRSAMNTLMAESWRRGFSLPWDRNHPTHLSNADLWSAWMTLPNQLTQRWVSLLGQR